jgi:hypothetical protein
MTHKNADRLSQAIDAYLGSEPPGEASHMSDVIDALAGGLPEVSSDAARERVRRSLAGFSPTAKSPQQLLLERAVDEIELLRRRFTEDEYIPWPTVVGGAAVAVAAVGIAIYLRRRGIGGDTVAPA